MYGGYQYYGNQQTPGQPMPNYSNGYPYGAYGQQPPQQPYGMVNSGYGIPTNGYSQMSMNNYSNVNPNTQPYGTTQNSIPVTSSYTVNAGYNEPQKNLSDPDLKMAKLRQLITDKLPTVYENRQAVEQQVYEVLIDYPWIECNLGRLAVPGKPNETYIAIRLTGNLPYTFAEKQYTATVNCFLGARFPAFEAPLFFIQKDEGTVYNEYCEIIGQKYGEFLKTKLISLSYWDKKNNKSLDAVLKEAITFFNYTAPPLLSISSSYNTKAPSKELVDKIMTGQYIPEESRNNPNNCDRPVTNESTNYQNVAYPQIKTSPTTEAVLNSYYMNNNEKAKEKAEKEAAEKVEKMIAELRRIFNQESERIKQLKAPETEKIDADIVYLCKRNAIMQKYFKLVVQEIGKIENELESLQDVSSKAAAFAYDKADELEIEAEKIRKMEQSDNKKITCEADINLKKVVTPAGKFSNAILEKAVRICALDDLNKQLSDNKNVARMNLEKYEKVEEGLRNIYIDYDTDIKDRDFIYAAAQIADN